MKKFILGLSICVLLLSNLAGYSAMAAEQKVSGTISGDAITFPDTYGYTWNKVDIRYYNIYKNIFCFETLGVFPKGTLFKEEFDWTIAPTRGDVCKILVLSYCLQDYIRDSKVLGYWKLEEPKNWSPRNIIVEGKNIPYKEITEDIAAKWVIQKTNMQFVGKLTDNISLQEYYDIMKIFSKKSLLNYFKKWFDRDENFIKVEKTFCGFSKDKKKNRNEKLAEFFSISNAFEIENTSEIFVHRTKELKMENLSISRQRVLSFLSRISKEEFDSKFQ